MGKDLKDSWEVDFKCIYTVMADLALLEDLENALKVRADLFNESTEWLLSQYHFVRHDFGEDVYIHVIIKGGVVT